eukprot:Gregarina_sp_Poly_1__594@NODE_113_length_13886_cov_267_363051_g100_i0_p5_GENE_NODE_113_length_13886_cov_267_363051_g100_i0NODE_113_length_13886_cov_267_363051_g100_i0_p5_ORF_typecomplete_len416_score49_25IIGP/PF05049_13/1e08FeoB_N/PF02421_18/0_006FeoB_N/PF02421_18/1_1e04_NODE_113_length_13886_cov_267_363051_g100_i01223713484
MSAIRNKYMGIEKMPVNVTFTGPPLSGTSTLFDVITGDASTPHGGRRHRLHSTYEFIDCVDLPTSSETDSPISCPDADVLVIIFDLTISEAELRLITEQRVQNKAVILVQSKMASRINNKDIQLDSYKDRIREDVSRRLLQYNLSMLPVYFVDGLKFWDFTFDEEAFLANLFAVCGCDGSITPRKEQILRRGHSKLSCRGIMAVVSFESESKVTRQRFMKWWFPSPIPLKFLLFELSVSNKNLTVKRLKNALLKKGLLSADFILILATEALLCDEGKEITQKLIEACHDCSGLLPATMLVSVVCPHLSPKVVENYPSPFMEGLPLNPADKLLTPIQREIFDRICMLKTNKDNVILVLNRAVAVLSEAGLLIKLIEDAVNFVAYWCTHYSTTYLLTVSYFAAMLGFSSILLSLMLW